MPPLERDSHSGRARPLCPWGRMDVTCSEVTVTPHSVQLWFFLITVALRAVHSELLRTRVPLFASKQKTPEGHSVTGEPTAHGCDR